MNAPLAYKLFCSCLVYAVLYKNIDNPQEQAFFYEAFAFKRKKALP